MTKRLKGILQKFNIYVYFSAVGIKSGIFNNGFEAFTFTIFSPPRKIKPRELVEVRTWAVSLRAVRIQQITLLLLPAIYKCVLIYLFVWVVRRKSNEGVGVKLKMRSEKRTAIPSWSVETKMRSRERDTGQVEVAAYDRKIWSIAIVNSDIGQCACAV